MFLRCFLIEYFIEWSRFHMAGTGISHHWKCIVGLLLVAAVGCGSGGTPPRTLAPTKGVVKYKGEPVAGATVLFSPAVGTPGNGMTDDAGNFVITTGGRPGAEIGKAKVMISKPASGSGVRPDMTPKDMEEMVKAGKSLAPAKDPIPTRYAAEKTSPLEADVAPEGESNVFEFNLVD
jgi:hypothetical protein